MESKEHRSRGRKITYRDIPYNTINIHRKISNYILRYLIYKYICVHICAYISYITHLFLVAPGLCDEGVSGRDSAVLGSMYNISSIIYM